jgi:succinate dehydrogenase/fumarate reductase-like Fe-S protein
VRIVLHIWRQRNSSDKGRMVRYEVPSVSEHMSFLEMLDILNEDLIARNEDPVAFDSDCREGICGMCNLMIDGQAHGPDKASAARAAAWSMAWRTARCPARRCASFTCAILRTATSYTWNRGARARSR